MNLTCPTKAILREERSEEVEHARVAPREEEAFLRGKDSNIIGNCPLFPLLLFFSLSSTIFSREKVMEQRSVSCFSFLENLFRITRNEINNFVTCFLGTYRTTICEIFFFEYISCLFIRGERKYKNLRMLETGGRGRLTRK